MGSKTIKGLVSAGVSAVLLWCAYPPVGLPFIVFVALVPLFICSRRLKPLQSALVWGLAGLAFWMMNLSWFVSLRNHSVGWKFVLAGWFVGPILRGLIFAIFGYIISVLWKSVALSGLKWKKWVVLFLIAPFLWTGFEWLRSFVSVIQSTYLGTAICQMPFLSAPARWGGEIMLGSLAIMVNGALALTIENLASNRVNEGSNKNIFNAFIELIVVSSVICLVFIVAYFTVPNEATKLKKFALVQRNAPLPRIMDKLIAEGFDSEGYYKDLLKDYDLKGTDFLVLGESSLYEFGQDVRGDIAWKITETLSKIADGAAVIASGKSDTPSPRGRYIQSALALYEFPRDGRAKDPLVYIKRNLVPFGEYNPLAKWFPSLRTASYYVESPGKHLGMFRSKNIKLSPLICSDCFVSGYARDAATSGAQVLVLISNNLWYAPSAEPMQHFWQAVARSVETGLPLVTAGNAGITGVVNLDRTVDYLKDKNGNALQCAPGVLIKNVELPVASTKTLYVRLGDVPLVGLFILSILSSIIIKIWE